jgi:membrane associated rhomboid family serine protease
MHDPRSKQPIFNAPAIVVGMLALLCVAHFGRTWLMPRYATADTNEWWLLALAFIPARYGGTFTSVPGGDLASVTSFLTHAFLHIDMMHLVVNAAWLLVFGSALARRIGTMRFLAIFAGSAICGALLFLAVNGTATAAIMVGASGAISGLVGAAFRFFFRAVDAAREGYDPDGLAGAAQWVPRLTLAEMIREPRTRSAVLVWLVLNFAFALAAPWMGLSGGIAWEAHLGGFLFGLLTFDYLDRTGIRPPADLDFDDPNQAQP